MTRDYAAGKFDAIVCWDLDRLTRQPRQLEDWVDAAEQRGLVLVTVTGEADLSTDNGRMFARIKATVARAEIERKGARQRAANVQRAERGRPVPGRRLYGFETDGVTPRETEADVVRRVFEDVLRGRSVHGITRALNDEGVPFATSRQGRWTTKNVRAMVLNRRYAGEVRHNGAWHPSDVVAEIVPAAKAERARLLVSDPARLTSARGNVPGHLASGVVTCGVCGAGVTWASKAHSRTPSSYRCPRDHVAMSAAKVEPLLVRGVAEIIAEEAGAIDRGEVDDGGIRALRARFERIERAASATAKDRDEGLLTEAAARARMIELRAERVDVERGLEAVRRAHAASGALLAAAAELMENVSESWPQSVLGVADKIAERFGELELDRQREVVRSVAYAALLPLRDTGGRRRGDDERVRVTSRRGIDERVRETSRLAIERGDDIDVVHVSDD